MKQSPSRSKKTTVQQTVSQEPQTDPLTAYFANQSFLVPLSQLTSKHFTDKVVAGIDVLIQMGTVSVAPSSRPSEQLMDSIKITDMENESALQKAKKAQLQNQLQYLRQQTEGKGHSSSNLGSSKLVLSKQEHKKLVVRLKRDKQLQDQKHEQFVSKLERSIAEAEQQQRRAKQEQLKIQLRNRREAIEANREKSQRRKQQLIRFENESKQRLKKLQSHKFVYHQIQENYQRNIVMPQLQQRKRKLKQLRQYTSFRLDELNEHQKQYEQQRQLSASRRIEQHSSWHYQPPPKSERLQAILEEENMAKLEAIEAKRRQAEERINRQELFIAKLRDQFTPTVDPAKEQQIKDRIEKSRTLKLETNDPRQIGINYLQFAKKHRRNPHRTLQERPETERLTATKTARDTSIGSKPRASTNYHTVEPREDYFYQKIRRRRIQKVTKQQQLPESERIKQLTFESQKITQKLKQKQMQYKYSKDNKAKQQTLQLLLSNIQAKIGILQMYQE